MTVERSVVTAFQQIRASSGAPRRVASAPVHIDLGRVL
jgi:hypothetical protein